MRICSLLPSATEIVFALDLGDRLVGVTHECDYPEGVERLPTVTRSVVDHTGSSSSEIHTHVAESLHSGSSIYALDQELLARLDPELILTQELCDVCAVSYDEVRKAVRVLPGQRRVLSLEPMDLGGILEAIRQVGELAGVPGRAGEVVRDLRRRIERVGSTAAGVPDRPRVFAMEWLDPPFMGGHWVPEMVRLAGGTDGLGRQGHPSRRIEWEEIAAYDPEVVVLMPCGYSLARTLGDLRQVSFPAEWHGLSAVRSGRVYAVNGSAYFNRPGPRIVDGLEILAEILHPERFPREKPPDAWRRVE
ncbi:MAG: cobalamin-binding protein [Dehalococcoidia bacterium]